MREIKFRAWDKRRNKWIEQDSLVINKGILYEDRRDFEDGEPLSDDDAELVGYTGLKDSHGNEVYEGDIIEAVFELIDGELKNIMDAGVVVFKDCAFQVQTFEDHHEPLHEWSQLSEELRVIGNIYENPELLPEVEK